MTILRYILVSLRKERKHVSGVEIYTLRLSPRLEMVTVQRIIREWVCRGRREGQGWNPGEGLHLDSGEDKKPQMRRKWYYREGRGVGHRKR